jgi:hypothetical protein
MKIINLLIVAALITLAWGVVGCAGPRNHFPLVPGDKIIFESGQRAADFRRATGLEFDPTIYSGVSTSRVVTLRNQAVLSTY